MLFASITFQNFFPTENRTASEKGSTARKHRRRGWGAIRTGYPRLPTQDIKDPACRSTDGRNGINGTNDIKLHSIHPSSLDNATTSSSRTAVISGDPGEPARFPSSL